MTLPSRITDDELAHLPLDTGLAALRAEITDQVTATERPAQARRRWPLVVAAAAAVAAVAAVPALVHTGDDDAALPVGTTSAPPTTATEPSATPQITIDPPVVTSTWRGPDKYVVLDDPTWRAHHVSSTPPAASSVYYSNSRHELTVQWEPRRYYASRLAEARAESDTTIQMLGQQAVYVVYDSQQQFAFLPVVDGYGFYVDASFSNEAEFAYLLASLKYADAATFAASLPTDTVPPDEAVDDTTALLADADLPPGWSADVGGWNSPGFIAGQLVAPIGCAWAHEFVAARAAGDETRQVDVIEALTGSTSWSLLAAVDNRRAYAYLVGLMRRGQPDDAILSISC